MSDVRNSIKIILLNKKKELLLLASDDKGIKNASGKMLSSETTDCEQLSLV